MVLLAKEDPLPSLLCVIDPRDPLLAWPATPSPGEGGVEGRNESRLAAPPTGTLGPLVVLGPRKREASVEADLDKPVFPIAGEELREGVLGDISGDSNLSSSSNSGGGSLKDGRGGRSSTSGGGSLNIGLGGRPES